MSDSLNHSGGPAPSTELGERLRSARSICVLTGAGISVESGLSTFRDPDGLWERYRPEDLANEAAFRRNPALVQGWYAARRAQALDAEPNAAHLALASLERSMETFLLVTQNVDGLHSRAGNENIVEIHGNIVEEFCIDCLEPTPDVAAEVGTSNTDDGLSRCVSCNGLLRPNVVWFGEMLPDGAFERASRAALDSDVFFSIGTSSVVYPAAELPLIARTGNSYTVEINVEPSALAHAMSEVLIGPAGTILPTVVSLLTG